MQLLLNIVDDNVLAGYPYVIKREEREGIDREYGLRPEDDVKVVPFQRGNSSNSQDHQRCSHHNYYAFTFWIDSKVIVLDVRSTGKIRELESSDYMSTGYTIQQNNNDGTQNRQNLGLQRLRL